jgi:hypothetical protein
MRVKPSNLNVGDVFYECEHGENLQMTVVEPVSHENGQWKWAAKNESGEQFNYLITDGYEHYGPKIYSEPQYI